MTVLEISTYGRNTLRRLRREARIMQGAIPHLAPAYELDPYAPTRTLISEYLPDVTLDDLVSISPLPAAAALHALQDVAHTLTAMHECGLVHGDVRPATVFILPDGRAALARPETTPPASGTSREVAVRTDARGFAVLAFELLTGVHPLNPRDAGSMATSLPMLPPAAAAELAWALTAEPDRCRLPRELVAALDAVPPEDWTTNGLRRTPAPAPLAPPLAPPALAPPALDPPAPVEVAPEPAYVAEPEPVLLEPDPAPPPEPRVVARIARPRRRRSLFRRILGPFVIVLGLLTVLGGGGTGAWLLFAPASAGDPVVVPLEVRRVAVSITPPQALCPRAAMHLAATIVTDGGGGELKVTWRLPDGTIAETQSLVAGDGRRTLRATFDLIVTGKQKLVGDVVAIVSPTGAQASAPIRYLCPGAPKEVRREQARSI